VEEGGGGVWWGGVRGGGRKEGAARKGERLHARGAEEGGGGAWGVGEVWVRGGEWWEEGGVQDEGPPDVEVSMRPLLERPGVIGYFVVNDAGACGGVRAGRGARGAGAGGERRRAGIPIKWSSTGFESASGGGGGGGGGAGIIPRTVVHFAALVSDLVVKSKATCRKLFVKESEDDTAVKWLRLRTNTREIIVAPGDGCTLVVIQRGVAEEPAEAEAGGGEGAAPAEEKEE
jgi:hypothetical protein